MNLSFPGRRGAVARACLALLAGAAGTAVAQTAAPSAATVVITGNPFGREDFAQPSSVLAGDGLVVRRSGTLGDTLAGLPGVASSSFGPQSARPVIRGLDGDRIRLLDNGGASVDASTLSFDHAVTLDPLVAERIEVLRGPAALLYGGNATGGVVNVIDNRIPRAPVDGLGGRAEVRFGGPAREQAGAAVVEGGAGSIAWHVDVAGRDSDDLRVPRFTPVRDGEPGAPTERIANSAGESSSGAVGASWTDADGYVGISLDGYRNRYGVTVEPDVTIDMKRDRVALAGERRNLGGPFDKLEFQASGTDYRHQEIEGTGEVGTTFKSRGQDLRVQARHVPIAALGGLRGVVGVQAEHLDFSALGEEAFVPDTTTRSLALFALEELQAGPATLSAGLRVERVRVSSGGDPADAEEPKFGAAARRSFTPASGSLGATLPVGAGWSLNASLGATERAPAYYELFANGVHVATGAFEVGDPTLGVERSRHLELGAGWASGVHSVKANVYVTRFSRYINLDATGRSIDEIGEDGEPTSVPEYAFRAVPARLYGFELQGRTRLVDAAWKLDATGGLDLVRGSNRDTGEPLARIAPLRANAGLEFEQGAWRAGAALRHAAKQDRVPATDIETGASTVLDLWFTWRTRLGPADALWFVKVDNLTDELAYNASAIRTARELAPQPGRALGAGLRVEF